MVSTVKLTEQDLFEIRADVRRAKHKATQIRIEAQLYAVSVPTIKKIVGGEDVFEATEHGQMYKYGYSPRLRKKEDAVRLIMTGLPYCQIAEITGLSRQTIRKYASEQNLTGGRKKRRMP